MKKEKQLELDTKVGSRDVVRGRSKVRVICVTVRMGLHIDTTAHDSLPVRSVSSCLSLSFYEKRISFHQNLHVYSNITLRSNKETGKLSSIEDGGQTNRVRVGVYLVL